MIFGCLVLFNRANFIYPDMHFSLLNSLFFSPSPSFVSGLTKYAVPKELFVMDVSGEITFFPVSYLISLLCAK